MSEINEKELNEASGGKYVGPTSNFYKSYTIKYGDTLSQIALDNGTTVAILQRLNNIPNPDKIRAGATILIPRN